MSTARAARRRRARRPAGRRRPASCVRLLWSSGRRSFDEVVRGDRSRRDGRGGKALEPARRIGGLVERGARTARCTCSVRPSAWRPSGGVGRGTAGDATSMRTCRPESGEGRCAPSCTTAGCERSRRRGRKRLVILDLLAQEFEPGRRYSEPMVNLMLGKWHADTAALRRYLVDEGFLDREAGEYWRSGGTVTA